MEMLRLNKRMSVAPQIGIEDVPGLAKAGFRSIGMTC